MKKNKSLKIILIILITLISSIYLIVKADSGFDSSWDSGGSWDSGSSWDSGGSWDSDSSLGFDSFDSLSPTEKYVILLSTLSTIIIVILYYIIKEYAWKRKNYKDFEKQLKNDNNQTITINKILEKLGNDFNIEEFYNKVYKIYYDVQIAWMNNEIEKVRNVLSDELFNTYKMQLLTLSTKNQKNVMEDINKENISIIDIRKNDSSEEIDVCLEVTCRDYLIDTNTKKVLRGNSQAINHYTYLLTFSRNKEANIANTCPNCGSQINNSRSSKCEYCHSIINQESNNFVMTNKKMLEQYIKEYRNGK